MFALLRKEINTFFAATMGYLVIGLFLVLSGLFLWVFKGEYNILDSGFADLAPFFGIAPWILLLLIPAVSMRSIAEERKQGTIELLRTRPLPLWKLVLGKYLGVYLLIIITLIPSTLYLITIIKLGNPEGNIDIGSTLGSYIALLLLASGYAAIGVFSSAITNNQIVAFLTAVFLCFLFYFGLEGMAAYLPSTATGFGLENFGMQLHYERISRGVLDTSDVFYFCSIAGLFIATTILVMRSKSRLEKLKSFALFFLGVLLFNALGHTIHTRFDLTQDHRFTLSETTVTLLKEIHDPVAIDILLNGSAPSEFRRLQTETRQLLETFSGINPLVKFSFINPLKEEALRKETLHQLQRQGLRPLEVSVQENGKTAIAVVVPWGVVNYQGKTEKIQLLKNRLGATSEERISSSVQQLEYAFADGLRKLIHPKKQKIAILKGNGQLPDRNIADFVKTLQEYYFIGAFTLDSVANNPSKTLEELQEFDLIINAKPTIAFSDQEKYVLDQFIMQGGKSLWLTESVAIEKDSLMGPSQSSLAYIRALQLNDLFFSYGVRINPVLINDLYSAPLLLASGQGKETRFTPYPWFYAPLAKSNNQHPIVTNVEGVKFDFANQIDTLKNGIKKTVLLASSPTTKKEGVPKEIFLDMIKKRPDIKTYKDGSQPLAVLLEGKFKSTYKQRIKPFNSQGAAEDGLPNKMIIIADGDVIKNEVQRGQAMELGFDRYTGTVYGNKEFLLNAVNYLLDDSGLITVRSKEITIPFLYMEKIAKERSFWQAINIVLPLLLLGIFALLFSYVRTRKYSR